MSLFTTATTDALPRVTPDQHAAIHAAPRTPEAHADLMAQIPAMGLIETGGTPAQEVLPDEITIVAWNLERGYFPGAAADVVQGADVVLLSEMDKGMARTGQRHPTAEMAARLGMAYAYGVEFHELDLGGPTERLFCTHDHNAEGWHGNAVLSSVPAQRSALIRVNTSGHWFCSDEALSDQPRVGDRMAIAQLLPTRAGPICVVSTHLESHGQPAHRDAEMQRLLDAVDAFAPDLPVIIGGDLNSFNGLRGGGTYAEEPLFHTAHARGYRCDVVPEGWTTGPSLITTQPDRQFRLDWLFCRGLTPLGGAILPRHDPFGRPLSDHAPVQGRFRIG